MSIRREFEGSGYFDQDHDGDYLLVERWTKRPDDLKGQSLTIDKLLPREARIAGVTGLSNGDFREHTGNRRFRFRITVEIEIVAAGNI